MTQLATHTLLIELGTAELPTQAVADLSLAWQQTVEKTLQQANIAFDEVKRFATARRLSIQILNVAAEQAEQTIERRGPALAAVKDAQGQFTPAALGFASSCGVGIEDLTTIQTDKGEWLAYQGTQAGKSLAELLPTWLPEWMAGLPIKKRMRWGSREDSFVRPLISLCVMLDGEVIPCQLFDVAAGQTVLGHRFHGESELTLTHASDYEQTLADSFVIADLAKRRQTIIEQACQTAASVAGKPILDETLIDEINALVEYPVPVLGDFAPHYLTIPQEVLIKTMQDNQKYFALVDANGTLLPHFITIANIDSSQPDKVKLGNQRVIEPRFADAAFFWHNDLKRSLASREAALKKVVFHEKLGSIFDRSARVGQLAEAIMQDITPNDTQAITDVKRAAQLSKCDLLSEMVFEFGELQGIMGRYYAQNDGEMPAVADAIYEQYLPKFAGDQLPQTVVGQVLSLADKLELLVGGFAIGAKPTGTKDPYGLRRATLSIIRLLLETPLCQTPTLALTTLLEKTATVFPSTLAAASALSEVRTYLGERLKGYYLEQGYQHDAFEAIEASDWTTLTDFDLRIKALASFQQQAPQIRQQLLESNKRITNILKKNPCSISTIRREYLQEPSEQALDQIADQVSTQVRSAVTAQDYPSAFAALSQLAEPLEAFFNQVMVITEDDQLKHNRLALLTQIRQTFLHVADLSLLQG